MNVLNIFKAWIASERRVLVEMLLSSLFPIDFFIRLMCPSMWKFACPNIRPRSYHEAYLLYYVLIYYRALLQIAILELIQPVLPDDCFGANRILAF